MAKLGQSSFRRILLSRILLLSVPVLLVGEYVTYRKARSGLLETARLNLTESAVEMAQDINDWVKSLQSNLILATESTILQSEQSKDYQQFIKELEQQLPTQVNCLQLVNIQTNQIQASSCGNEVIIEIPPNLWAEKKPQDKILTLTSVYIQNRVFSSQFSPLTRLENSVSVPPWRNKIQLVFMAPVYVTESQNFNQLKYVLILESSLPLSSKDRPKSLTGFTVVLDEVGRIIAHPEPERVGVNINEETDGPRLQKIIDSALSGEKDFVHLFFFDQQGNELLAGYDAVSSPISQDKESQWVILAVTSLDDALSGLKEINSVLFYLTISLIAASIIAALYLSRDLARPLERLRDYALTINSLESPRPIPQNLKIREFIQLGQAISIMVERLQSRASALELATKEAQIANQLKDEFLRIISHELRTPLNGIINSLQFLRDDLCDTPKEEQEYLDMANKSALHLYSIVNDILDIALIQEGQLSITQKPVDLVKIIREAIATQSLEVHQKGLSLKLHLQDPIKVWADPDKLKQVLLNILSNAVKFTKKGRIIITAEVLPIVQCDRISYESCEEKFQAVIVVQDTGIGIAVEKQDKLFQPFAVVDGSTTREFGGIGLGLSISQSLMTMMGGSIELYSKGENQGTTVTLCIPVALSSSETKLFSNL
ncbi:ATP-binding protein [Lyngbya sp. PCC 8106]|uniref:sensor histidine kinase n=1 Tax=Lyngbya sp. (strain PCC 8106) TaxID=313612 RepID=UPI0000EAA1F6|nr:ATP-binding protein [Lyngbya sp. PCC 8106]EAW37833.1 two-component sensor histidine kinase [Lyngbya sp. PCC 8106]